MNLLDKHRLTASNIQAFFRLLREKKLANIK